jgi:hypothetical protein
MLASGYRCPCGCSAVPSADDLARDLWVQDMVGSVPRYVPFAMSPADLEQRKEPSEPMEQGICRGCGSPMQIAEYLAEFLRAHKAPWPECDACARLVVH